MTLTENFEPDNIKINSPELLANHHEYFLFSFAKAKLNMWTFSSFFIIWKYLILSFFTWCYIQNFFLSFHNWESGICM